MSRNIVERNRSIKATLERAFGRGRVRVRGSRGSAYGYVDADIDWTPLDSDQAGEMRTHCYALLRSAGVDLGSRYTDDTCAHTCTELSISFNRARYFRTMRHSDGTLSVLLDSYRGSEWVSQAEADAATTRASQDAYEGMA